MSNGNGSQAGWKTEVVRWLFHQGPVTVILFLILFGGYRIANYAVDVAIPAHLRQIQDGYEKIEAKQAERFKGLADSMSIESEKNREVLNDVIEEMKQKRNDK